MQSRFRRPEPSRGFILFFGTKPLVRTGNEPPVRTRCPKCEQEADFIAKTLRNWFTLFLVPVFPVGKEMRFSECTHCRTSFRIPPQQLKNNLDQADSAQRQRAIAMYNLLRNSPANSVTLNDLMALYATLNDLDAAIAAARDFPGALHASEQCMVTLGRVYLAKNDFEQAVQWFDHALQRDAQQLDANYFKAVALLTQPTPDLEAAQSAARAARNANHPNAELLLRDIESRLRQA